MYDWVLNTPLEGLIQNASRKELTIAPVVFNNNCLAKASLINYENAALRKALLNTSFVERFKMLL